MKKTCIYDRAGTAKKHFRFFLFSRFDPGINFYYFDFNYILFVDFRFSHFVE